MKKCKNFWRDGYFVIVKNKYSMRQKYRFIPSYMVDSYNRLFGDNIIHDEDFINWYCQNINQIK